MKSFGAIVVALVVGIVVGAWQPRGEVLALRERLDDAEARAAKECRSGGLREIQGLLGAAGAGEDDAAPGSGNRRVVRRTGDEGDDDGAAIQIQAGDGPRSGPPSPAEIAAQLDTLKAGLDARRAHALEALAEQAKLDEAQRGEIEGILAHMNESLRQEVDGFVDDALAHGEVERRDVMEFGANALDVVIAADDALRSTLDEEQYAALDEELTDPLAYVSGDTVSSLARAASLPGFGER